MSSISVNPELDFNFRTPPVVQWVCRDLI